MSTGPYGSTAFDYLRAGWSPLPLPPGEKSPVPTGWTGARGATPSGADVMEWVEAKGAGNIALRLPPDVIGVDVDDYDEKHGGTTLAALELALGALPPTWVSGSREGVSGIRFYRVPPGLRWPGGLGDGIDTLRFDHRYAIVWPSVHPKTGRTYTWRTPAGDQDAATFPTVSELPDLPPRWVEHFTAGERAEDQAHAGFDAKATYQWFTDHTGGEPCGHVNDALGRGLTDLMAGHDSGRHDSTLKATNRLLWLAGEGHPGTGKALQDLYNGFLQALAGSRDPYEANSEWMRMINGAVDIAAGAHPQVSDVDPCTDPFRGILEGSGPLVEAARLASAARAASTSLERATTPNHPTPVAASPETPWWTTLEQETATWTSPPTPTDPSSVSVATPPQDTLTTEASGPPVWPSSAAASVTPSHDHQWGDLGTLIAPPPLHPPKASSGLPGATPPNHPTPALQPGQDPGALADDAVELEIRRNQAASLEAERIRAQMRARRMVQQEDQEGAIYDAVQRKAIQEEATDRYRQMTQPPPRDLDAGTLEQVLARPPEPAMRVRGLIPWGASTLVVAMRKTGKSTLLLNYAQALLSGEPFLGDFDVIPLRPDQFVVYLNYEVSAQQLARWAAETGIDPQRLILVNLRGEPNPLATDEGKERLRVYLQAINVGAVIIDPFGRAYTGDDQNSNAEVGSFLVGLDEYVRVTLNCEDLVLATHAGWDGERTRGASALEDWPDSILTMTMDEEGRRFLKAQGRDVDIEEDALTYHEDTRKLTRSNMGSRKTISTNTKVGATAVLVLRAIEVMPGCSRSEMCGLIGAHEDYDKSTHGALNTGSAFGEKGVLGKAVKMLVDQGYMVESKDPVKGWLYYPTDTPSTPLYNALQ